jgi:AcrR family transcriptional regulator
MADGRVTTSGRATATAASLAVSTIDAHAIECASRLFLERGIAAVKMTDIADAAGMGVATLYRHFSTKTAIAASSAIVMWSRLMETYEELVATEAYASLDGAGRLETLLSTYCDQCVYQPGFAAFLDELDRLMLAGDVARETIDSYTQQLGGAYHHFEEAYRLGLADGSIARETDFPLFYRSVAHALLCVASKLSRGEVLPTDDFSHARDELTCITDMAIRSLRIQG